jgi:hypothetical protein
VSVLSKQTDSASEPRGTGMPNKTPATKPYSDAQRPDSKVLAPANTELATVSKS